MNLSRFVCVLNANRHANFAINISCFSIKQISIQRIVDDAPAIEMLSEPKYKSGQMEFPVKQKKHFHFVS